MAPIKTLRIANLTITHVNFKYKFSFIISFIVQIVQWVEEWDSFHAVSKKLVSVAVYIGSETHWASYRKIIRH